MTTHDSYVCDGCMLTFGSIKELIKHYEQSHPDLIERVTIPI